MQLARRIRILGGLWAAVLAGAAHFDATAAERQVQIYDAEIEHTIRSYAAPLLRAAKLDAGAVHIHLVRAKALNAFVAGGQRMFVTTGLIMAAEHPGQVIGVLAHEIGHIAAGHLARLDTELRDAVTPMALATILAGAAGVLARDPAAAIAIGTGASHTIQRNLLSFSRAQERAADRAAIQYLEATGQSARGLLEVLEELSDQEELAVDRRQQTRMSYDVTHPLTRDRILYVREQVAKSRYGDAPTPPAQQRMHARAVAKLYGFLNPPAETLRRYRADDASVPARYARAIAHHRRAELTPAMALIDGLIDEAPDDPYFHELKGQMLFENGRVAEALPNYERAAALLPHEPLLRVGLAHAQIETGRQALLDSALANLRAAIGADRFNALAWRLAATAYGRKGNIGMAALSSAEHDLLTGRRKRARDMAGRAQRLLDRDSPGWLRAADIVDAGKPEAGAPGKRP